MTQLPDSDSQRSPWAEPDAEPQKKQGGQAAGITGFILSLLGPCTCGITSLIGLIVSIFGLLKPPRGFAIAGTIIGGLGVVGAVGFFMLVSFGFSQMGYAFGDLVKLGELQTQTVPKATTSIEQHYQQNNALPGDAQGQALIAGINDPWGTHLRYQRINSTRYMLISAGPDGQLNTNDDAFVRNAAGGAIGELEFRYNAAPSSGTAPTTTPPNTSPAPAP